MNRKSISILAVVALSVLLFVAAGCGGSKNSASTAADTGNTPAATTDAATTEDTATEDTTTEESSGNGSVSEDCKEFSEAASKVGQDFSAAVSGTSANIDAASKEFDELAAKAPDEIKPDFETINDAFKKIAGAFNNGKPDVEKLQKLSTEIDTAKLTQASQNISAWATKNCSGG